MYAIFSYIFCGIEIFLLFLKVSNNWLSLLAKRHVMVSKNQYTFGITLSSLYSVLFCCFLYKVVSSRFTARITELMQVLNDLNKGRYQRTMVSDGSRDSRSKPTSLKPGSGRVRHLDHVIKWELSYQWF